MKNALKISLKPNEKIYVNGAVIKVDRKVSLEFLNDVQFLLQHHVLQPEDTHTPLRQLYFVVQVMLMNPEGAEQAGPVFKRSLTGLLTAFKNERMLSALKHIDTLVCENQFYEALKAIRTLYSLEEEILTGSPPLQEIAFAKAVGE